MAAYYNEIDPFAAAWLRELIKAGLIADGEVDERSIELVRPDDLRGFAQCHFFAGIGGWSYALRLAGWPDNREVWTGSCPCQPSSSATHGRVVATEFWPEWNRLIDAVSPSVLFGEQVKSEPWVSRVVTALEDMDYEVAGAVLPALCVGQDHLRERFFFVGHTDMHSQPRRAIDAEAPRVQRSYRHPRSMGAANGVSRDMVALSGFGNAIVPQVAQAFIESYLEAEQSRGGPR